jgi:hypothetical protein
VKVRTLAKITIKKRRKDGISQRYHISTKGTSTNHLKDWEKTLDETYLVHFYNNKTGKKLRLESVFIANAPNEWQIREGGSSFGNIGKIVKHSIKSKSEALRYAKAYMRRH